MIGKDARHDKFIEEVSRSKTIRQYEPNSLPGSVRQLLEDHVY
jgi:hypothetical protein